MLVALSLSMEDYKLLGLPLSNTNDEDCQRVLQTQSLQFIPVSFVLQDEFVFDALLIVF
jgi:hypothetical protein